MGLPLAVRGLSEFCPFRGRLLRPPDSANVKQVCFYTVRRFKIFSATLILREIIFGGTYQKRPFCLTVFLALILQKLISREI